MRAIGDRLVIERLEVNDPGAARVVQEQVGEGHQPAETVARAIEIGARVIESEGTAANVDYVKAELERQLRPLAERLGGVIEEGQEEFAERLAGSFDSGAERLGPAADPGDADHGDGASAHAARQAVLRAGRRRTLSPTSRTAWSAP